MQVFFDVNGVPRVVEVVDEALAKDKVRALRTLCAVHIVRAVRTVLC